MNVKTIRYCFDPNTKIPLDREGLKVLKSNINPRRGNKQQTKHRKVHHSHNKGHTQTVISFPELLGNHIPPSESSNDAHVAKILSHLSKVTEGRRIQPPKSSAPSSTTDHNLRSA